MTDSELLRLLRSIDKHNQKILRILQKIEESDRKDRLKLSEALIEQCVQFASAESVGGQFLGPKWVSENGTCKRKGVIDGQTA